MGIQDSKGLASSAWSRLCSVTSSASEASSGAKSIHHLNTFPFGVIPIKPRSLINLYLAVYIELVPLPKLKTHRNCLLSREPTKTIVSWFEEQGITISDAAKTPQQQNTREKIVLHL